MKTENGPALTYELVYTLQKRPIHSLGPDGYYHKTGEARGVLVRSVSMGRVMYHMPEEMLEWKFKVREASAMASQRIAELESPIEIRHDGQEVRKDRWEKGFRSVVSILGLGREEFEIDHVLEVLRFRLRERSADQ